MLLELVMATALSLNPDPLSAARARFEQINTYQLTVRSEGARREEIIRYTYQKPGFIRMDMVTPFSGAVLIYSPESNRVRVWPFGRPEQRSGMSLRPTNPLVRSARGHRVDQSDVGTLLENIGKLQADGTLDQHGEEVIDGRAALHLVVQGRDDYTVGDVARYEFWLDREWLFPLKVVSFDRHGEVIERARLEDIVIDPVLPPATFFP